MSSRPAKYKQYYQRDFITSLYILYAKTFYPRPPNHDIPKQFTNNLKKNYSLGVIKYLPPLMTVLENPRTLVKETLVF